MLAATRRSTIFTLATVEMGLSTSALSKVEENNGTTKFRTKMLVWDA